MTEARMQETPEYKPGTFCWVELATTDGEGAKKFYTELFGWTANDMPVGPGMTYSILLLGGKEGKDVGALYQMPPEMTAQGIPPNWLSYVSVTSADESATKAKELGATLMKEPFDVMTVGRMAVVQDPTGAVFAIWQAGDHKGASVVNVPGSLVWNELATTDTAKAGTFYTGLFGWGKDTHTFGPLEYTIFQNGERGAGGMFEITPEMAAAGVPPHWLAYFAVDDCDAKVKKATELGAKIMKPADNIPGVGRFAILQDPQGAAFAVIKTEPAPA
ncbi:MAG TPA: VOC family protein [Pyrinomonadaceae bacterium]|jgi:predicted enzyme related to lactoylglutathione lyase|nr:VOC family protein [Pyrinomonadaceae bacterium]